jgi:hypothetical protein
LHPDALDPDCGAIAGIGGLSVDALGLLFPTAPDLADSILRSQVYDGGLPAEDIDASALPVAGAVVIGGLDRLAGLADRLPGVFSVARGQPVVGGSLFDYSVASVRNLLLLLKYAPDASSSEIALELVEAAWLGSSQFSSKSPILDGIKKILPDGGRI